MITPSTCGSLSKMKYERLPLTLNVIRNLSSVFCRKKFVIWAEPHSRSSAKQFSWSLDKTLSSSKLSPEMISDQNVGMCSGGTYNPLLLPPELPSHDHESLTIQKFNEARKFSLHHDMKALTLSTFLTRFKPPPLACSKKGQQRQSFTLATIAK